MGLANGADVIWLQPVPHRLYESRHPAHETYLHQPAVVVEPLLDHLGDQEGALVQQLLRHQDAPLGLAHVQPLPEDGLLAAQLETNLQLSARPRPPPYLRFGQEVDGEEFAVAVHQRQEGALELVGADVRVLRGGPRVQPAVRLQGHQGREVAPGVPQGDRRAHAEALLPQQGQVDSLESGVAQGLPAEALHVLHAVHDYGAAEDVGQGEDVQLLQAGSGLARQREEAGPVLLPLGLVQGVLQERGLTRLVLLPAGVEPEKVRSDTLHAKRHYSSLLHTTLVLTCDRSG
jgi:hypothetical protein